MTEALFPRSFRKEYTQAVRGSGCYLYTSGGKKLLDAAGGAAVVTIGHGVKEVAKAMARQAETLAYVHSSQFVTLRRRKPCREIAVACASKFPTRRASLFHIGRLGSHGNRAEALPPILPGTRRYKAVANHFAQAELPRQHARRALGFRKRPAARSLRAHAPRVGTHPALLLLPLPAGPEISQLRCGMRG